VPGLRALLLGLWLFGLAQAVPAQETSPAFSDPRTATTAYEQALRLVAEGRRDEARVRLDQALREHPRNPQLRFLYGVVLAEARRTEDAIAVFEQLTQDYPELPEPYNNLAVMFAARGELERARAALESAVRALPGYALAHENLGDVHLRLAVRAWERAASLDPTGSASGERLSLARALVARIEAQAPPR
jgi:Flp pilus assembly protein TadD